MRMLINVIIVSFLLICSCQAQEKTQNPPGRTAIPLGDPMPHSEDPKNPWTVEKLKPVEIDVQPGQKLQIEEITTPEDAKEAVLEYKVANSVRSVDLFVITSKEAESLRQDLNYVPKDVKHLGSSLGGFFPIKPGIRYTVWLWNKEAEQTDHLKLELIRHYR